MAALNASRAINPSAAADRSGVLVQDAAWLPGVNAVRLFAALAVVWIHCIWWSQIPEVLGLNIIGRFSVPFYCALVGCLMVFGVRRQPDRGWIHFGLGRFRRLGVPFLAWSAIYVAAKVAYLAASGREVHFQETFLGWHLLYGSASMHLWFLPFALIAGVALFPLVVAATSSRWASIITAIVLALLGVILAANSAAFADGHASTNIRTDFGYFVAQSLSRTPALLWGVAIGLLWSNRALVWLRRPVVVALVLALFAGCVVYVGEIGRSAVVECVAGVFLLSLGASPLIGRLAGPTGLIHRLGRLSFGVYLCHMLVFWAVWLTVQNLGLTYAVWWRLPLVFLLTASLSFAAAALGRRFAITRVLFPS